MECERYENVALGVCIGVNIEQKFQTLLHVK